MTGTEKYSLKGYSFGEALYRNKDSIKGIIAILGGINVALAFGGGFDWKMLGITLGSAVFTLGVKLLSDLVDFYFKE